MDGLSCNKLQLTNLRFWTMNFRVFISIVLSTAILTCSYQPSKTFTYQFNIIFRNRLIEIVTSDF